MINGQKEILSQNRQYIVSLIPDLDDNIQNIFELMIFRSDFTFKINVGMVMTLGDIEIG